MNVRWTFLRAASFALGLTTACGEEAQPPTLVVEIGIPDESRRMFEPLGENGTVYYSKGAQVQEFIMLAVRAKGTDGEAFVDVTVERVETGDMVYRTAKVEPEPLTCDADGWCALVPVLLPAAALGDLRELEGAAIAIEATVFLDNGSEGTARAEGALEFL